jgi:hypothetical protein
MVKGAAVLLWKSVLGAVHFSTPTRETHQTNFAAAGNTSVYFRRRSGLYSKFFGFLYKFREGHNDSFLDA